ncbi:TetR/AcrR family transcriptional regulator [Nocardia arthritidis]|uniref:TetR family transcriptional regulator n=1 Tax=Nocardia arthritidis TaxID=228602 RepID=A0A6G9YCR4_9NOCA|nr:TetR/AcrR family transcriptional regulator [Nocardia arthritidis]QIS10846.1 TetR family transcriptional regulator [Nocardia arthritidis]
MTGQPRRADALRNRDAIVAAARDLVVTRGPGIGMDEIASSAGVAVGTLYRHFPAKQDLIAAVVADLDASISVTLRQASARVERGETTALDELVALLRRVVLEPRHERLLRHAVTDIAADAVRDLRDRARISVADLVAAAHRSGALYPDITVDDITLLLTTSPDADAPEPDQIRWLTLARRALGPV